MNFLIGQHIFKGDMYISCRFIVHIAYVSLSDHYIGPE